MSPFIILAAAESEGQVAQIRPNLWGGLAAFGRADHQLFDCVRRSVQVRLPAHPRDAGTTA